MAILLMLRPCLHSDCALSGGSKEADHLYGRGRPEPMSMKAMG